MSVAACVMPRLAAHRAVPETYSQGKTVGTGYCTPAGSRPGSATQGKTKQSLSRSQSVLDRTPVEVLVQVFRSLDLATALSLASTSRRFANIFAANRASIVLTIAEKEFSPLNGLLQVVKASPGDLATPWGTWLDKRIRRKNTLLSPGGTLPDHCVTGVPATRIRCAEAWIEDSDIDRIVAVCQVVRGWENMFPRHRFSASPQLTRSLSERENFRLRRALYHWMRYAYYFHGDLARPNVFVPAGRDIRANQLRALPNSELGELRDLWTTVEDIVGLTMCPSVENVRISADFALSEKDAARIGWGEQLENRIVVATMRKLSPGEMLHYLENAHRYPKTRLVQSVRQRHPHMEFDTESLSTALSCVSLERWLRLKAEAPAAAQAVATNMCMPRYTREGVERRGGILDGVDGEGGEEQEDEEDDEEGGALDEALREMTGHGLDCRPDETFFGFRPEIPPGMLNA